MFERVGDGVETFFCSGLPNAIYQSGLTVAEAFGAEVTDD
jgi:hypothetical protein